MNSTLGMAKAKHTAANQSYQLAVKRGNIPQMMFTGEALEIAFRELTEAIRQAEGSELQLSVLRSIEGHR